MTPYETQSLEVAKAALTASIWADIIAGVALLTIITGSVFAFLTLKTILAQLKAAQWSTLLSLEQEMASRGEKFQEFASKLKSSSSVPSPLEQEQLNAFRENYFNAIDRFASLVLNGQFPQQELKQDYRDLIADTISAYPNDFHAATHYRKVVKLHNKWADA